MQRFIGTKLLEAQPMTRGTYLELRGWDLPADENPDDDGYLVMDVDGGKPNVPGFAHFVTWTPADVFERSYRTFSNDGMPFGMAMEALKSGMKVARQGWNGVGMFLYLVPAASYPAQTGVAKQHFGADALVPYDAYIALKNALDTVSTWSPSCNDALADDWYIV